MRAGLGANIITRQFIEITGISHTTSRHRSRYIWIEMFKTSEPYSGQCIYGVGLKYLDNHAFPFNAM